MYSIKSFLTSSSLIFLSAFVIYINAEASPEKIAANKDPPQPDEPAEIMLPQNNNPCGVNQVLIDGLYCPNVIEKCLRLMPDELKKKHPNSNRCAEYAPSKCISKKRIHMKFCMDKFEAPNIEGELPSVENTFYDAVKGCEKQGKRLCTATEATFACEGEDMKAYPYGDGWNRDVSACNMEREAISPFIFKRGKQTGLRPLEEVDQRAPSGSFPNCVSSFGVYDIVANADEFVINENGSMHHPPYRSALHGGHYVMDAANRCRKLTTIHGPNFSMYITSYRCCSNVQ